MQQIFRIVIQNQSSDPVMAGSLGVDYPKGSHPNSFRLDMTSVVWGDDLKDIRSWLIGALFEAIPKTAESAAAVSTILVRIGEDDITKLPDDRTKYGKIVCSHHIKLPVGNKKVSMYFFGSYYDEAKQKEIQTPRLAHA